MVHAEDTEFCPIFHIFGNRIHFTYCRELRALLSSNVLQSIVWIARVEFGADHTMSAIVATLFLYAAVHGSSFLARVRSGAECILSAILIAVLFDSVAFHRLARSVVLGRQQLLAALPVSRCAAACCNVLQTGTQCCEVPHGAEAYGFCCSVFITSFRSVGLSSVARPSPWWTCEQSQSGFLL